MQPIISRADTYILAAGQERGFVSRADAYIMTSEREPQRFEIPGSNALLASINQEYGLSFNEEQVRVENPSPSSAYVDFDSKVTLVPLTGSGYSGSIDIHYNRYPLGEFFTQAGMSTIALSGETTIHQLIAKINQVSGKLMTAIDLVDGPIGSRQIVLTAAPTSFYFRPGSTAILN